MKVRKSKTLLAVVLALVMVTTTMSPAFAALQGDIDANQEQTKGVTYTAPTTTMEVDDNIITGSVHRAATPALGIMGVNILSGNGMINGGNPADLAAAESSAALGIWGTALNDSPDPYFWNYFYNYYASENGLLLSDDAVINPASGGGKGPQGADTTLLEEYGNVSESISTRPDILLGVDSADGTPNGYDDQIATINAFPTDSPYYQEGDETYSPKQVKYATTTIKEMIESMHRLADAITEVENETGKTTRYGDVQQIADDYEAYVYGIIAYVQQQLAAKGVSEKTVALIQAINEDGTYTLVDRDTVSATSTWRPREYCEPVTKNMAEEVGTIATLDQLLQADVIVTFNNQSIPQSDMLESFGDKTYDGILLTNYPASLYGITMNSVENAVGYAYTIGCIYSKELGINPVELCAYFYQHFLHISDMESLKTVVQTNFAQVILPEGLSSTLPADYSEAKIQAQIDSGMAYLAANPGKFISDEYTKIGMSSGYSDVARGTWYFDAVKYVTENSLFQGAGNNLFNPNAKLNLASLLTVLYRVAHDGENPATGANWYDGAMNWGVEAGLVSAGVDPNAEVTREDFITMFYQTVKSLGTSDMSVTADITKATDYASLNKDNLTAISWAVGSGLIKGSSTTVLTIDPNSSVMRSVVAQMLENYYQNL